MHNREKLHAFQAFRRWMLGVVLALAATTAAADPQFAMAELQRVRAQYATLELDFQFGKAFASVGNAASARSQFERARIDAALFGAYATRLQQQNQDSLQRGLYDDRAALERAIVCNSVLRAQASVLQVQMAFLVQQPLSQAQIASTDVQMAVTKVRLQQCIREQQAAGS
ncbi:MAG: hypothetical protein ACOY82_19890 [Pseudomonadota bacterium]